MRRTSSMGLSFPPFTRAVKQLLIANGVVYLVVALLGVFAEGGERWIQISLRPGACACSLSRVDLAVGDLRLSARRAAAHLLQHAGAVDVRRPVGTGLGLQHLHAVLFFLRRGCGADHRCSLVYRSSGSGSSDSHRRRVGAIFGLLLAFGILYSESEIMLFPLPF